MSEDGRRRVIRRVELSGALPVSRDTPSYTALLGILWGGGAAQLQYALAGAGGGMRDDHSEDGDEESGLGMMALYFSNHQKQ